MGSDTNLMVKAKIACKSTASQEFSFVPLPRLLIESLLADAAWCRLYSQGWSIHPAWLPFQARLLCTMLDEQHTGLAAKWHLHYLT